MKIETISDFRTAIRNGPYAWPGGYPLYFITADGSVLSFEAAKSERRAILEAIYNNPGQYTYTDGEWLVVAVDVNWEDPQLYCDHSNEHIPSAYGDDDDDDDDVDDRQFC